MGLFNTYGKTQLKVGDLYCKNYSIGDKAEIPDGIYLGYYGIVVVYRGIFILEQPYLIDKDAIIIDVKDIIAGIDKLKEN